jgi:hypothetical protein
MTVLQQRESLKETLRNEFEMTLEERADRCLSVKHLAIIPGDHHFAHAMHECVRTYQDGYFTSCITLTQAVNEGILKFVAERNGIKRLQREKTLENGTKKLETEKDLELAERMQQGGIVSQDFLQAYQQIAGSHRNDFHHMNPPVGAIGHHTLAAMAKQNLDALFIIEQELFSGRLGPQGTYTPDKPIYWDIRPDGTTLGYFRMERLPGLHPGAMQAAEDFDAPLPDDFWMGRS